MHIQRLIIGDSVLDKIWSKHNVPEREVFQVFENDEEQIVIRRSQRVTGAYVAFGCTFAGRYLAIPFKLEPGGVARVLTARDMTPAERRGYRSTR